jgi:hypothetical protein
LGASIYRLIRTSRPAAPVFSLPAESPAVVTLIAPLPAIGVAAVAPATLPIIARASSDGFVWLKLDGGAQIVGEANDDATPLGVLLPLDEAWPIRLLPPIACVGRSPDCQSPRRSRATAASG